MSTPSRPEPSYPLRSQQGIVRHAKKRHVRTAYMNPMPKTPFGQRSDGK